MENQKKKKVRIGKIEVVRHLCIGAASCTALAQNTFELDQGAKAVIIDPKGNSDEDILEAAKSCPTDAIIVFDTNGNQIWPEKN